MKRDLPKIFVLVLSYNGKHLLEECISSYLNNNYTNFEVVVIDNGSTDKTREWVESKWVNVKVLRTEKNLGYSGGFNYGMNYAFRKNNAEYVLISNNDVKADANVITELLKVAESDESVGFVTGKVYYYDQSNILQTVGYYEDPIMWIGGHLGNNEEDKGQFDKIEERPYSDDIFMLVKKNIYDQIGGYDTEFKFQGEQFDWQVRAKNKGYKIYFTPYAKIWHKESMTIGKTSPFKTYYDVRNTLILKLKYKDDSFLRIYFKYYLKNIIIKPLFKYLIKLKIAYFIKISQGFFSATIWALENKKFKMKYLF